MNASDAAARSARDGSWRPNSSLRPPWGWSGEEGTGDEKRGHVQRKRSSRGWISMSASSLPIAAAPPARPREREPAHRERSKHRSRWWWRKAVRARVVCLSRSGEKGWTLADWDGTGMPLRLHSKEARQQLRFVLRAAVTWRSAPCAASRCEVVRKVRRMRCDGRILGSDRRLVEES